MPTHFEIRIATLADEQAVTELLEASYPALMKAAYPPEMLTAILPAITKGNPTLLTSGTFYLAETTDQTIIGCGGWTKERPGSSEVQSEVGHIRHFATHPDWIKKAVGRSIYAQCEQEAKADGIKCFECYSSLNAVGFYAALGFQPIQEVEVPLSGDLKIKSMWMKHFLE